MSQKAMFFRGGDRHCQKRAAPKPDFGKLGGSSAGRADPVFWHFIVE